MELREFIKTAITDITNAVSDLQKDLTNGAIVNSTLPSPIDLKTLVVDNEIRPIEQLSFGVAVTASEEAGIKPRPAFPSSAQRLAQPLLPKRRTCQESLL